MTSPYLRTPSGGLTGGSVKEGYQEAINRQKFRGIASLTIGNKTLTFRTNPNSIMYSYKLNTAVENTYGGRCIQLLSTTMQDLKVVIECGLGGWSYAMKVAEFMRDMIIDQRDPQTGPGTFLYTTRGWNLKVYAANVPFQDRVTETTRELTLSFKIQEDVSGILTKQTVRAEIARLRDGIGFQRTQFNSGSGTPNDGVISPTILPQPNNIAETLTMAEIPAIDPFASSLGTAGQQLFGGNFGALGKIINSFGR